MEQEVETSLVVVPKEYPEFTFDLEKLNLIHFADPRLQKRPPDFDFGGDVNPVLLANSLFKRMEGLGGIGLSANQLGLPYRMFVFGKGTTQYNMFNPLVIGVSKETVVMEEGCLSFPELFLPIKRPAEVTASYTTEKNTVAICTFKGLAARIFLHEYDHMEGVTFIQHASKFKVDWALKKIEKQIKKNWEKLQEMAYRRATTTKTTVS